MKYSSRLKILREKKNKESNKLKQLDEQVHEQNKELDKIKATRNKYQQDLQQIQTLKSKIYIVEKKVVDLQNGRTTVEEIKKSSTKEIKVLLKIKFLYY